MPHSGWESAVLRHTTQLRAAARASKQLDSDGRAHNLHVQTVTQALTTALELWCVADSPRLSWPNRISQQFLGLPVPCGVVLTPTGRRAQLPSHLQQQLSRQHRHEPRRSHAADPARRVAHVLGGGTVGKDAKWARARRTRQTRSAERRKTSKSSATRRTAAT